jgi:DNA-binding NtrC family response regulator
MVRRVQRWYRGAVEPQERTAQREVHWVVRGGTARTPDGVAHAIDVDPVVVGRDPGAQIVVADREVSMAHLELQAVTDGILVRDLGSTNGTFVGPFRVREGIVRTPTVLTLGATTILVEPSGERNVDVGWADGFGPLVGRSPRMRRIFGVLERIAPTPLSVLILGETGTGKEVVAKALHDASPRARQPFVVVDCGSIPPTLAESILFGHEKGSFTGADQRRKGAIAEADGGTLFLDELGELPLDLQPKLLRALSEKQIKRVGGNTFDPVDVRVLAATRRDITAEMNAGRFRSDLYFRIAQVRVELPPLRERATDIPQLVEGVCQRAGKAEHTAAVVGWVQQNLGSHDWPGNVRELVNVASVAATLADTPGAIDDVLALTRDPTIDEARAPITAFAEAKRQALIDFERTYFAALNDSAAGNVSEMARQSGMERHHVRAYLRKHKIGAGK